MRRSKALVVLTVVLQLLALAAGVVISVFVWTKLWKCSYSPHWNWGYSGLEMSYWYVPLLSYRYTGGANYCLLSDESVNMCVVTFIVALGGFVVSLYVLLAQCYPERCCVRVFELTLSIVATGVWIALGVILTVLNDNLVANISSYPHYYWAYDYWANEDFSLAVRVLAYVEGGLFLFQSLLTTKGLCTGPRRAAGKYPDIGEVPIAGGPVPAGAMVGGYYATYPPPAAQMATQLYPLPALGQTYQDGSSAPDGSQPLHSRSYSSPAGVAPFTGPAPYPAEPPPGPIHSPSQSAHTAPADAMPAHPSAGPASSYRL